MGGKEQNNNKNLSYKEHDIIFLIVNIDVFLMKAFVKTPKFAGIFFICFVTIWAG